MICSSYCPNSEKNFCVGQCVKCTLPNIKNKPFYFANGLIDLCVWPLIAKPKRAQNRQTHDHKWMRPSVDTAVGAKDNIQKLHICPLCCKELHSVAHSIEETLWICSVTFNLLLVQHLCMTIISQSIKPLCLTVLFRVFFTFLEWFNIIHINLFIIIYIIYRFKTPKVILQGWIDQ